MEIFGRFDRFVNKSAQKRAFLGLFQGSMNFSGGIIIIFLHREVHTTPPPCPFNNLPSGERGGLPPSSGRVGAHAGNFLYFLCEVAKFFWTTTIWTLQAKKNRENTPKLTPKSPSSTHLLLFFAALVFIPCLFFLCFHLLLIC